MSQSEVSVRRGLCFLLFILGSSQQIVAEKTSHTYVDEDYGFSLEAPDGWARANPTGISVPGEVCRAWSPDGTATIVVFMQHADKEYTPSILLEQSATSVKTRLGAQVREQEVKQVAGMQAMWLVFTAKGTGGMLDGKGSIPTMQHWVAIPREKEVLVLLLTAPESNFASLAPVFQSVLGTLKVSGTQTEEQKAKVEKPKEKELR
ncbi:MAG: hypothetical protein ACJ76Y_11315 [Thermoanaerobaculia bacterium]